MPTISRREVALPILFKFGESESVFHVFIPEKEDHDSLVQELRTQGFENTITKDMVPKNMWDVYREDTCLVLHKKNRDEYALKQMSYANIKDLPDRVEKLYQYISGALYSIEIQDTDLPPFSEAVSNPIKKGLGLFSQKSREMFDETLVETIIEQTYDVVSKSKKETKSIPDSDILSLRKEYVFDTSKINIGDIVFAQFKAPFLKNTYNHIVTEVDDYTIILFDGITYEKINARDIKSNIVKIKEIIRNGER